MAELILQAPQFLYLYSEGTPVRSRERAGAATSARQRLSYFLWDALPDAPLLGGGRERRARYQPPACAAQAERLLADERAKPVLRSFLAEWLELDGGAILPSLDETPKERRRCSPASTTSSASEHAPRELETFMDHVMFEEDGSLEALFCSTRAYVNAPLAEALRRRGAGERRRVGVGRPGSETQRAGMLTRAGFLAVHASQSVPSPIRRGVYMLTEVLCVDLPSPPANVDNTPVEITDGDVEDGVTTVREATLKRTGSASCAGCHARINELGFAFEHYDAVGRWQDSEARDRSERSTLPLSSPRSGKELDGTVDGAIELSSRLAAESRGGRVRDTQKWFEVALRRSPVELDACSVQTIKAKIARLGASASSCWRWSRATRSST